MPSGSSDLPSPTSSSAAAGEAGGGARRDPCREAGDDAGLSLTWCPCRPLSPPSSPPSQLAAAEAEAESQREAAASVSSLLADVRSEAGASRDTARRLEVSHAQLEANAASYRAAVVAAMGEARASAARVAELSSALRAAEAGASAAGETDSRWRAAGQLWAAEAVAAVKGALVEALLQCRPLPPCSQGSGGPLGRVAAAATEARTAASSAFRAPSQPARAPTPAWVEEDSAATSSSSAAAANVAAPAPAPPAADIPFVPPFAAMS